MNHNTSSIFHDVSKGFSSSVQGKPLAWLSCRTAVD
jgi:hypothetical protein